MSLGASFVIVFFVAFGVAAFLGALLPGVWVVVMIVAGLIGSGFYAYETSDPAGWIFLEWILLSIPAVTGAISGLAVAKAVIDLRSKPETKGRDTEQ